VARGALDFSFARVVSNGTFVWAEGRYSSFKDDRRTGSIDGSYAVVHFGADIPLSQSTVAGVMVSFDGASEEDPGVSELSGSGWMIGPYFSSAIHDRLILSGRLAIGQSRNDAKIDVGGTSYSGDFETNRFLSKLTLTGQTEYGRFTVLPEVSLSYGSERQAAYSLSAGGTAVNISGQDISYGRLMLGVEIRDPYGAFDNNGFLFFRPTFLGTFEDSASFAQSTDLTAALELGYEATPNEHLRHGVSIGYEGVGSPEFEAVSVRAFLEYRF
jgi:hypothetical protein